jgi:hypothetical protein
MSESIEYIKEISKINKEESQKRRANNKTNSAKLLSSIGISYEEKNNGHHLIVFNEVFTIDFWPSTGKFIIRGDERHFRGVKLLIKIISGKYSQSDMKSLKGER